MTQKHIIPIAPGIFADEDPVIAILIDPNNNDIADGKALVLTERGQVQTWGRGVLRNLHGAWKAEPLS